MIIGTFLCVVAGFIILLVLGLKREKSIEQQILAEKKKQKEKEEEEKQRLKEVTVTARKHRDLVNKYRGIYAKQVAASVEKHFLQLKSKEKQLVYTNDYGQVIFDDFYEELASFSEKVVGSEITFKFEQIEPLKKSYAYFKKYFRYFRGLGLDFANRYLIWPNSFFSFDIEQNLNKTPSLISIEDATARVRFHFKIKNSDIYDDESYANEYAECDEYEWYDDSVYLKESSVRFAIVAEYYEARKSFVSNFDDAHDEEPIKVMPLDYEKIIASTLKDFGFDARTTKASGDQGADVLAQKNGISFAIQCKMYSKPVGNKAVQEANAGRDFYSCDYGVVVSNAGFTKAARQAAHACNVILLDDNQLYKLLSYTQKK